MLISTLRVKMEFQNQEEFYWYEITHADKHRILNEMQKKII